MYSLRELLIFRVVERSIRSLSYQFLEHLFSLSMPFFIKQKHGDITSILQRATSGLSTIVYGFLFYLFPLILEMGISSFLLARFFGIWYGVGLLFMFVVMCTFSVISSKSFRSRRRKTNKLHGEASGHLSEVLLNFETISYFGAQAKELNQYDELLEQKESSEAKSMISLEIIYMGHTIIIGLCFTLFTLALGKQILNGNRSVADLMMLHGYLMQFFMPLGAFGIIIRDAYRSLTDMERFYTVLSTPSTIIDKPHAPPISAQKVSIIFDNVTFGYPDKEPILKNVSFEINPGEIVTLVGKTGAGKSTIIKLLYRLYDVLEGTIIINGKQIKEVQRLSLAQLFGVVPQDPVLLNKSIAHNIAYGSPTASSKQIAEIAQQAQLKTFIETLPKKYETTVGEQGIQLSRGERQRIALARVLLKNPSMYIFDEATASLDEQTKKCVLENIQKKCYGKTTLIITHQPWNMILPNKELRLEQGQIIVHEKKSIDHVSQQDHYKII